MQQDARVTHRKLTHGEWLPARPFLLGGCTSLLPLSADCTHHFSLLMKRVKPSITGLP